MAIRTCIEPIDEENTSTDSSQGQKEYTDDMLQRKPSQRFLHKLIDSLGPIFRSLWDRRRCVRRHVDLLPSSARFATSLRSPPRLLCSAIHMRQPMLLYIKKQDGNVCLLSLIISILVYCWSQALSKSQKGSCHKYMAVFIITRGLAGEFWIFKSSLKLSYIIIQWIFTKSFVLIIFKITMRISRT